MTVTEFQKRYPTREDKIEAAKKMSDKEIDNLIESCQSIYGKIFYNRLKEGFYETSSNL